MATQQWRIKFPLLTYKGNTNLDAYIQEFDNVCLAN